MAPGVVELVLRVGQLDGPLRTTDDRHRRRQQAVVRADEHSATACHLDRDGPPRRPDARIDDGEHDPLGNVGDRSGQRQATRRARRRAGPRGSGR